MVVGGSDGGNSISSGKRLGKEAPLFIPEFGLNEVVGSERGDGHTKCAQATALGRPRPCPCMGAWAASRAFAASDFA